MSDKRRSYESGHRPKFMVVVDKTPEIAIKDHPEDLNMNFVFPDQDDIIRHRVFAGLKAKFAIVAATVPVRGRAVAPPQPDPAPRRLGPARRCTRRHSIRPRSGREHRPGAAACYAT